MKLANVTKRNVYCDRRVLGENWKNVYGGYFVNPKVFAAFIRVSRKVLASLPVNPKVLYVCSGSGALGELVCDYLRSTNRGPSLTLVDVSAKHLKQDKNHFTRKIKCDVLFMALGEKFDLIIMRSALHYFPTLDLQVKVLKQIARHLTPKGIFINQCPVLSNPVERDIANAIHASTAKMGRRHFHCPSDIPKLYARSGLLVKLIGTAPRIVITSTAHSDRYGLVRQEVENIWRMISHVPQKRRPSVRLTKTGYKLWEAFPIYTARKIS